MIKKVLRINIGFLILFSFVIKAQTPKITLLSPNGGEQLFVAQRYSISWLSQNVDKISLFYKIGDKNDWIPIVKGLSSELGSYSWRVLSIVTDSLKIKIRSNSVLNILDVSNDYVTINQKVLKKIKSSVSNNENGIKILPLGNSITFDNRKNDPRSAEDKIGYRYYLYNLLNEAEFNFVFVGSEHAGSNYFSPDTQYDANAGFPGIKDDELYSLLATGIRNQPFYGILDTLTDGKYLESYPADVILLHIGTNGNNESDGTSATDVENILDEIDRYENLSDSEIFVFVARIINRSPSENYVTEFNDNIESMILDRVNNPDNDAYPDNVFIVDMEIGAGFDYIIDSMGTIGNGIIGDMNDQLHPNDKGYFKMAQKWFEAIEPILNSPPIIESQPKSAYLIEGDSVKFSILASGKFLNSFQWKQDGINIPGETDSTLIIKNINLDNDQSIFSCLVTSLGGTTESEGAVLNVTAEDERVTAGIVSLYNFNEATGNTIYDSITTSNPLDFTINTPNSVLWLNNGLSIIDDASITFDGTPTKLFNSIRNTDEMTVEMWIKPESVLQFGPARILTYSKNRFERNFGFLQNGNRYEFRLRTSSTDNNGTPSLVTDSEEVKLELTHLVYTISKLDTAKLFINGILKKETYLDGNFSNWDSTFFFGLANEFIDNEPWKGNFYLAAIYDRSLSFNEISHNFDIGIKGVTSVNKLNDNENFVLYQNYPNPFNPSTFISYYLPEKSDVNLTIYDVLGKPIKTLVNKNQGKGNHSIEFLASDLSSGVYLAQLKLKSKLSGKTLNRIKKLLLLK